MTIVLVLMVVQGCLFGAMVSYLNEGIPRCLWSVFALNAALIAAVALAAEHNVLAVASAGVAGAAFAFVSNPSGATA